MDSLSIRVTHRTELGVRAIEKTIEISAGDGSPGTTLQFSPALVSTTNEEPRPQLEWSPTLCKGERVDYAAAEKACTALGEGWRLPTRMELESILDLTRHDPAVDTTRFPDTKSGWYWTSTQCAFSSDYAWYVSFDDGDADCNHRGNDDALVRAVRSLPLGQ